MLAASTGCQAAGETSGIVQRMQHRSEMAQQVDFHLRKQKKIYVFSFKSLRCSL
jgi:hypothetical protein